MNRISIELIYILVLAGLVGYEVIRHVPPLLHTPLMSATNAISGISLVGSLVAAGSNSGRGQHDPGHHRCYRRHHQRRRRLHDYRSYVEVFHRGASAAAASERRKKP